MIILVSIIYPVLWSAHISLGTLDVKEVYKMFNDNGIIIQEEPLFELFSIVDKDNSGSLDLDEFKLFIMSEEAAHRKQDFNLELLHCRI